MQKKRIVGYLAPEIEVNEICAEQGFANSIEQTERQEEFEW